MPLADSQVLVLAPRFPSINQSWIDTYLEQLQAHALAFCVVSQLRRPIAYDAKVDRLRLRERVAYLAPTRAAQLMSAGTQLARDPRGTLRFVRLARRSFAADVNPRRRAQSVLAALSARRLGGKLPGLLVLHAHSLDLAYAFLPMALERNLPLVLTFHGLKPAGVPQTPAEWRRAVFEGASCVLVNTKFAREHALQLGCPADKLRILPQGLPLEEFEFTERAAPGADEPLQLLSVGRFHRDKGQHYSLLALRRLLNAGMRAHWHFVGVGDGVVRLRQLANRLNVDEHVTFHEGISRDALTVLYRTCHLFVLGSVGTVGDSEHVETQGVVLQEAQASGCIPIATRVGGIPECIDDDVDGLLIPDRSHRALVAAIQTMMASPERWTAMQRAGRQKVADRFSSEAVGRRMAEMLRAVRVSGAPSSSIRDDESSHDAIEVVSEQLDVTRID